MSNKSNLTVATMGIDIGKNSFHVVGSQAQTLAAEVMRNPPTKRAG